MIPGLSIYIEPDEMSIGENLNFLYEVKSFDKESLQIDLEFNETAIVSTKPGPDYLVIQMKDFRDPEGKLIVDDHKMQKPIPT